MLQRAKGPPFANTIVDSVTTLDPADPVTVSVSFDGTDVHFSFGIPKGDTGEHGEVTTAAMTTEIDTAIAGTSANTNAVDTLDDPFANDSPTLTDIKTLWAKMNEPILAMRR